MIRLLRDNWLALVSSRFTGWVLGFRDSEGEKPNYSLVQLPVTRTIQFQLAISQSNL